MRILTVFGASPSVDTRIRSCKCCSWVPCFGRVFAPCLGEEMNDFQIVKPHNYIATKYKYIYIYIYVYIIEIVIDYIYTVYCIYIYIYCVNINIYIYIYCIITYIRTYYNIYHVYGVWPARKMEILWLWHTMTFCWLSFIQCRVSASRSNSAGHFGACDLDTRRQWHTKPPQVAIFFKKLQRQQNSDAKCSKIPQGGAPKIAKLVYKWFYNGLW